MFTIFSTTGYKITVVVANIIFTTVDFDTNIFLEKDNIRYLGKIPCSQFTYF